MENSALSLLLSGKKYLLLQGPMGPFFSDVAQWLETHGRETVNVVFNGGDQFYCRHRTVLPYHATPKAFPGWLKELYRHYEFDTILCFGDCRPLHREAKRWAQAKGIRFLAFEEGYLRPHFITVEQGGVNAFSGLPRESEFYRQLPAQEAMDITPLSPSFSLRVGHAITYYLMGSWHRRQFAQYRHHKSFSPVYEARCWIRAACRKYWYGLRQRNMMPRLRTALDQRYYLVILQVYNDSQIRHHSPYQDVRDYINDVIYSFAKKAPADQSLVIKHHPMDRGHRLYSPLIRRLSEQHKVSQRVFYVHDLPMPELLNHARGVVTINSTAGISALVHNKPLKVMGRALYDIRGLTFQGHLHQFWGSDFKPDMKLFQQFRTYLLNTTQINAVYYGENHHFQSDEEGVSRQDTRWAGRADKMGKTLRP
ncbi:capsule biosynthesis protein [Nissabacter sp. SGAir0207]|uniref:capsule biosynthesis protein n=1 Tax=Nissabacter sp. SGAir0207 TaxID=2126321 RepID=UPI0010CCCC49|nr:capsular biosynthesis protein [Nissabacter sp. SGAir0207]QCR37884.1 capsular biosynthesis protein [Nissabacter sp. SGAir0207]